MNARTAELLLLAAISACSDGIGPGSTYREPLHWEEFQIVNDGGPEVTEHPGEEGYSFWYTVLDSWNMPVDFAGRVVLAAFGGSYVLRETLNTGEGGVVHIQYRIPASARQAGNTVGLTYCLTLAATCTPTDTVTVSRY